MTSHITTSCLPQSDTETAGQLFDKWFDPIEAGLRAQAREFLQALLEAELDEVLARSRYARRGKPPSGDSQRRASLAIVTATGRARCWAPSGRSRSRCRAPD